MACGLSTAGGCDINLGFAAHRFASRRVEIHLDTCRDMAGESGMGKSITDQEPPLSKWERIKYFLVIAAVVLSLVLLLLMMIEGAVFNFQCSLYDFLSFECNRWDAKFKPWKTPLEVP
ncbi:MAG: hypothetical protein QGF20_07460 [Alphaproteobacteria bacterium]|nr:hypothetical protein [Alphaproteobacteria bacterium]